MFCYRLYPQALRKIIQALSGRMHWGTIQEILACLPTLILQLCSPWPSWSKPYQSQGWALPPAAVAASPLRVHPTPLPQKMGPFLFALHFRHKGCVPQLWRGEVSFSQSIKGCPTPNQSIRILLIWTRHNASLTERHWSAIVIWNLTREYYNTIMSNFRQYSEIWQFRLEEILSILHPEKNAGLLMKK